MYCINKIDSLDCVNVKEGGYNELNLISLKYSSRFQYRANLFMESAIPLCTEWQGKLSPKMLVFNLVIVVHLEISVMR